MSGIICGDGEVRERRPELWLEHLFRGPYSHGGGRKWKYRKQSSVSKLRWDADRLRYEYCHNTRLARINRHLHHLFFHHPTCWHVSDNINRLQSIELAGQFGSCTGQVKSSSCLPVFGTKNSAAARRRKSSFGVDHCTE